MVFKDRETGRRVWVRNTRVARIEDGSVGVVLWTCDAEPRRYETSVDFGKAVEEVMTDGADAKIAAAVSLIKDGTPPEVASVLTGITIAAARALDQALS